MLHMHYTLRITCVLFLAVINMPLSLKYALKLTSGTASVGFTAATGSMWQNHDILNWRFQVICIPSHIRTHTHTYTYTYTHTRIDTHTQARMHARTHARTHAGSMCMCFLISLKMDVWCVCVCVCGGRSIQRIPTQIVLQALSVVPSVSRFAVGRESESGQEEE